MRKKKNKKWLVFLLIVILVTTLILLINFSKSGEVDTKLNLSEKRWIETNKKEVINIAVANDIPGFSLEGEGVFFDFADTFEKETGLSLNLISYNVKEESLENDLYFEVVKNDKVSKIKDKDMVFYKDHYVVVSKKAGKISDPSDIKNKKIGVLANDLSDVSFYISSDNNVSYQPYEKEADLEKAFKNDEVDLIAVPKTRYLAFILENKYHAVYNLTEMSEAYVLKTSDEISKQLSSIVNKKYLDYKMNYLNDKYSDALLSLYLEKNNISEKSKADFLSKKYVFGYIENEPYTKTVNTGVIGLDSAYINSFSDLTDSEFTFKKYRSVKDLKNALNKGEVDIAPAYYNYSGLSGDYAETTATYDVNYVVLTYKSKTDIIVNSIKSLKDKDVITTNSILAKYLKNTAKANVKTYDRSSVLARKVNKDSIVVLDQDVFNLYKDNKLANYRTLYTGVNNISYGYIIKDSNENATFKTLFTTYLENLNTKQVYNKAWKNYLSDAKEANYNYLYVILTAVILIALLLLAKHKLKLKKLNRKESAIRYIDPLTSLKNRNYLNKNFKRWEDNAIYPQAIVVINLNNLRHVNDVYGHEEGDKLIKLAANILVRNQLEQSDIIRTDGNEYLIYMVGYEKNKVESYLRKLYKELKELPYGYGATLGYSMIEDDIKTIDDAINEAVLEIRANKEMASKSK